MKVDLLFDRLCGYFLRGIRSIVSLRGLPQGGSCSPAGVSGNVCHLRLTELLWVTRPAVIACSTILPPVLKVFTQWQGFPMRQVQGHWRPGSFSVEPAFFPQCSGPIPPAGHFCSSWPLVKSSHKRDWEVGAWVLHWPSPWESVELGLLFQHPRLSS